jgi:hypothetical protein
LQARTQHFQNGTLLVEPAAVIRAAIMLMTGVVVVVLPLAVQAVPEAHMTQAITGIILLRTTLSHCIIVNPQSTAV